MSTNIRQVLVTGATGFLGSRLIEHLSNLNQFNLIRATGRSLKTHNQIHHPQVEYLLGDLVNPNFCQELVEGMDAVINCASLSAPWGQYKYFFEANCITQKNLVAASEQAKVQRFIYISSPSVYAKLKDRFSVSESDPLPKRFLNHYADTKIEAERILASSNLPYIIFRPRALTGRWDTVIMPRLIKAYHQGRLKIIGNGENLADLTPVQNAVHAIQLGLTTSMNNYGEVYNISNGEPVPLWEVINYALKKGGFEPIQQKVPYSIALPMATLIEMWAKLTRQVGEPTLTRYTLSTLAHSMTLDISKAKSRLGYQPPQTIYESIDEFIAWKQNNPKLG